MRDEVDCRLAIVKIHVKLEISAEVGWDGVSNMTILERGEIIDYQVEVFEIVAGRPRPVQPGTEVVQVEAELEKLPFRWGVVPGIELANCV